MGDKKKLYFIIVGVVFLSLGIMMLLRIYIVNERTPQTQKIIVQHGDTYEVKKGIAMSIGNIKWLNSKQLEEYSDYFDKDQIKDYKGIEVEVILNNVSKEEKTFSLFKLYIESENYDWNGSDISMFMQKNEMPMRITLQAGETKKVIMPYTFLKSGFPDKIWNNLQQETYFLLNKRYPNKVCWLLT